MPKQEEHQMASMFRSSLSNQLLSTSSLLGIVICLCLSTQLFAQSPEAEVKTLGKMPVKIVGGKLIVRCELSTSARRIQANLMVELGQDYGLKLHSQPARAMNAGAQPLMIHFQGAEVKIKDVGAADDDALGNFTRLYSRELGEVQVVGTLGNQFLKRFNFCIDLKQSFIQLDQRQESEAGDVLAEQEPELEEGSIALRSFAGKLLFPVKFANSKLAFFALASNRIDSLVDKNLCEELNQTAGRIGKVSIAEQFDLSQWIALRPSELPIIFEEHPDGQIIGVAGINFLECYRLEFNMDKNSLVLSEHPDLVFPEDELSFFEAQVSSTEAESFKAFLSKYPDSRLASEAAEHLLSIYEKQSASLEDKSWVLKIALNRQPEDLRATFALEKSKLYAGGGQEELAIELIKLGIDFGSKDRYPEAVHKLHTNLGILLFERGEQDLAWEHLLSAAFGLPDDGEVNYYLGRFYEERKRYKRATSRYIQAMLVPEVAEKAVGALERVQEVDKGERLSVDTVNRMVGGKVRRMTAPNKFEDKKEDQPADENKKNNIVLVEWFSNPHIAQWKNGAWESHAIGASMATEALTTHFERSHLLYLNYQLDGPLPSSMQNSIAEQTGEKLYRVGPDALLVNGHVSLPGAAKWRDGQKLYQKAKEKVIDELREGTDYSLSGAAELVNGELKGSLEIKGPATEALVQVLLVEKGVLHPGRAKIVVHRNVVRAGLLASDEGYVFTADGEDEEVNLEDLENLETGEEESAEEEVADKSPAAVKGEPIQMSLRFRRSIAEIEQSNLQYLQEYEASLGRPTGRLSLKLDPKQLTVIALLRAKKDNRILQAIELPLGGK